MSTIPVSNEELLTVRDTMRTLNRIVDGFEPEDKVVLTRHGQMVAVILPLAAYEALVAAGRARVCICPVGFGAVKRADCPRCGRDAAHTITGPDAVLSKRGT
jgi:antitoxin (DNA-binding transcriptional repressor) of toxin-antitoxin stability system